ncbi:LacI family DNA-binding transcriptional regulator [Nocardiopsis sp. NPDC050513]|uniref:LacI family DNA-binding transcriptional regulator n=1 Tax=Nocardiopsis sp. NPDC050513 TaxID=3364338 RepID=UPI00379A06D8
MRRPTIMDIARVAGVSKGAVSYALNGKPGVSEQTRQRIVGIARDLGWAPSGPARALSSGGRVGVIGLVVDRPAHTLGVEPFLMRLVSGIEAELAESGTHLLFQVVEGPGAELATYRRWAAEQRVDGVVLVDPRVDDPRPDVVDGLALPAVVVGSRESAGPLPGLHTDDGAPMREVVRYLAALGHRRITRVAGPESYVHTRERSHAFREAAGEAGIGEARTVCADHTGEAATRVTRTLLAQRDRPTALVFDSDLMAVAGLGVAREMGVDVPSRLSVVAWDDSVLCGLVRPSLTAVARDVAACGNEAARMLLALIEGEPVESRPAPRAELHPRASTGPLVS